MRISALFTISESNWAAAAKELDAAIAIRPDLWKAQTLLALCARRMGDEKRAREGLKISLPHLEAGPFKTNAEIELIESLYKAGDLDGARWWLDKRNEKLRAILTCLYHRVSHS